MKALFQNYSSTLSTEPMYLHRCLVEVGKEAFMWNDPNQSAFDTFDYIKPDVFITHFTFLTQDIVKYLSHSKNIAVALNVTGASESAIEQVKEALGSNLITMFTNLYGPNNNLKGLSSEVKGIYPGADVFLPAMPMPEYKIKNCIFSLDDNEQLKKIKQYEDEYHVVSFNNDVELKYSDMVLDVASAASFYGKYETCHLAGDINFASSQILFDCIMRSEAVKIKVPDEQQETLDKIFAELFKEPNSKDFDIAKEIKTQVRQRHNCFRRASRLFRFLKDSETSAKLQSIGGSL